MAMNTLWKVLTEGSQCRVVCGDATLDGSGTLAIQTGLSEILGFQLTLKGGTAPSTTVLSGQQSANGLLTVYSWAPTAAGNTALTASSGTENFSWVAIGK